MPKLIIFILLFSRAAVACDLLDQLVGEWKLESGRSVFSEVGEAPVTAALHSMKLVISRQGDVFRLTTCKSVDSSATAAACGTGSFKVIGPSIYASTEQGEAIAVIGQCNAREIFMQISEGFRWPDSPVAGGTNTWSLGLTESRALFSFSTMDFWGDFSLQAQLDRDADRLLNSGR